MSTFPALRTRFRALTALGALLVPAAALAQPAPDAPANPPAASAPSEPKPSDAPPSDAPPAESSAPSAPEQKEPAPSEPVPSEPAPAPSEPAPAPSAPAPAAPEAAAEEEIEISAGPTPAAKGAEQDDEDELEPEAELTVAGTRVAHTAGSAHVIRNEQLERFEYDDATKVVTQVPGVYVRTEDGMGLRPNIGIRGVNPDRSKKITLMEDGILFGPAPYSAPAAYFFPLMTRMTQVRVIKGPGSVAYGPQTVGGAIDFGSRAIPSQTSGALDLALGQYGYTKAHAFAGTSDEQIGFLLEGVHVSNDGFKELPDGADTGFTRNEWMAKGSYILDPRAATQNKLEVKLTYTDEKSNETYLGLTDDDFREDPNQRYPASALDQMNNHRTSIVVSHELSSPSDDLQLKTTAYRHDYHRIWRKVNAFAGTDISSVLADPYDPNNASYVAVLRGESDSATDSESILIGPNDRTFVSQGVQSVVQLRPTTGPFEHRFESGVRFHNDSIKRRHSQTGYQMIGGRLYADGTPEQVTAYNFDETFAVAVHMVDAISVGDLTVTPGVRTEYIWSSSENLMTGDKSTGNVLAVVPGAGAYYGITDSLGVLAGAYRGFSPPAPGGAAEGEAKPEPEYSINYESGVRYTLDAMRVEAIGFYNDYSNMTDHCTLASGCVAENLDRQFDAGKARIYGVELFGQHEIPLGPVKIPLMVAYTLTRSEFLNSFESDDPMYDVVEKGDELPYVPRHTLNATVGIENDVAGLDANFNYVAAMREQAGSEDLSEVMATEEQFWFDLSAHYQVLRYLKVYSNLRNVLDQQYITSRRPYGARPNAPRWFELGAKLSF